MIGASRASAAVARISFMAGLPCGALLRVKPRASFASRQRRQGLVAAATLGAKAL